MDWIWYVLGGCGVCSLLLIVVLVVLVVIGGKASPVLPPSKGEPIISALLLEGDSFPADVFLKELAKTKYMDKSVSNIDPGKEGIFSFDVGDEFFVLALMPAPYPASDMDGPLATAWMWPQSPPIENVKRHRSHLLITMHGGTADLVRRRLLLTAVTALAAKQLGVMAVFWPEGTLVVYPPVFIEMAETINSPIAPPLYLWVDLRAIRNEDGTTGLFTTGLTPLGQKEIEIPRIDMEPGELREWLLNIMYYLLEKGPVLKHGQTIGISADHKVRIRHCASIFGHPGEVIRLEP
jgi:Domain of unknown function (DUF4261)